MDIKEIKEERDKLRRTIGKLLTEFTVKTRCNVTKIDIEDVKQYGDVLSIYYQINIPLEF